MAFGRKKRLISTYHSSTFIDLHFICELICKLYCSLNSQIIKTKNDSNSFVNIDFAHRN